MAGGYPLHFDLCAAQDCGSHLAATNGTTFSVASGPVSAYSQLIAATTYDTSWISVHLASISNGCYCIAVDIASGGAGAEQVIAKQLIVGRQYTKSYNFPIHIPAGTRIAARALGDLAGGGTPVSVAATVFDSGFTQMEGIAGVESIGFSSGTYRGAVATAGTSSVLGNYAQLTAATARDYMGLMVGLDPNQAPQAAGVLYMLNIAIGAAGNEVIILPNLEANSNGNGIIHDTGPFYVNIPSGTRLAANCQSTVGSATMGVTLYGLYE